MFATCWLVVLKGSRPDNAYLFCVQRSTISSSPSKLEGVPEGWGRVCSSPNLGKGERGLLGLMGPILKPLLT